MMQSYKTALSNSLTITLLKLKQFYLNQKRTQPWPMLGVHSNSEL